MTRDLFASRRLRDRRAWLDAVVISAAGALLIVGAYVMQVTP